MFNARGVIIRQFLKQGKGESVWKPRYFTIDFTGDIYISDKGNLCITICDKYGNGGGRIGKSGDGFGQFKMPTGIARSIEGRLVVVDGSKNDKVLQIFEDTFVFGLWK